MTINNKVRTPDSAAMDLSYFAQLWPTRRGRNLIEINDGVRFSRRAGLIARQLRPWISCAHTNDEVTDFSHETP
jgi:hypothetical protein